MNKQQQKVFEFIEINELSGVKGGVDTNYVASKLDLERSSVSRTLNSLVKQSILTKTKTRPVKYFSKLDHLFSHANVPFRYLTLDEGDMINKKIITSLKGAVHYPSGFLNIKFEGEKGLGKNNYSRALFQYAINLRKFSKLASFEHVDFIDLKRVNNFVNKIEDDINKTALVNGGFIYIKNMEVQNAKEVYPILDFFRSNINFLNTHHILVIVDCNKEDEMTNFLVNSICKVNVRMPNYGELTLETRNLLLTRIISQEARLNKLYIQLNQATIHDVSKHMIEASMLEIINYVKQSVATAIVNQIGTHRDVLYLDKMLLEVCETNKTFKESKSPKNIVRFDSHGDIIKKRKVFQKDDIRQIEPLKLVLVSERNNEMFLEIKRLVQRLYFEIEIINVIHETNRSSIVSQILKHIEIDTIDGILVDSSLSILGIPSIKIPKTKHWTTENIDSVIQEVISRKYVSKELQKRYILLETDQIPHIFDTIDIFLEGFASDLSEIVAFTDKKKLFLKQTLLDYLLKAMNIVNFDNKILIPTSKELKQLDFEFNFFKSKLRKIETKYTVVLTTENIWSLILMIYRKE